MAARSLINTLIAIAAFAVSAPASAADLNFEFNQSVSYRIVSPETYLNRDTDTKVTATGTCVYINLDFPCDQLDRSVMNPGDLVRLTGLLESGSTFLNAESQSVERTLAALTTTESSLSTATTSLLVIDTNLDLPPSTAPRTASFGPSLTLELITPLPASAILFLTTLAGFIFLKSRQRSA